MDGSNILSGGVDALNEIKECLLELYGNQSNNDSLLLEEEMLDKSISTMEQDVSEEIQKTTKKRRQVIEDAFDKQMEKLQERIKRIKDKREKRKDIKVSQRIDTETAPLRAENTKVKLDSKTLFKQKHIPRFCNTKLYYALYSPSCFTDYVIILGVLLLTLLLIPCGIYFFLLPEEKILYLILTYVITVIFFGGIYVIIGNRTKEKYTEDILIVKGFRSQVRVNKKKMKVIKNNIKRDRDESSYELQDFDAELIKLEQEFAEVGAQKKEALSSFDNTTSLIIASEIEGKYRDKLEALKAELERASTASKQAEGKIKALTIKVASEYEPFIGQEMMTLQRVDSLIGIIQAGNATNISEAVSFYKQSLEKDEDAVI